MGGLVVMVVDIFTRPSEDLTRLLNEDIRQSYDSVLAWIQWWGQVGVCGGEG